MSYQKAESPRKRKSLGQHYLVDSSIIRLMVDSCEIKQDERVLEIGTGRGALTKLLCQRSNNVEAYELDEANYTITRKLVGNRVNLHLGNAFLARPKFDVLVSSLPYSESSNFVEWLSQSVYDRAVVILQEDFVDKLVAKPHESNYRAISVLSQISSSVRILVRVSPLSFSPPPKVSSVMVDIKPRMRLSRRQIEVIKMLFSQKRRRLSGVLRRLGLDAGKFTPEQLSVRIWDLSPSAMSNLLDLVD